MAEYFDIYDEAGNRLGTAPRSECHGNPALIHCTVHIAVLHPEDGRLLLQNYWEVDGAPSVSYEWYERAD